MGLMKKAVRRATPRSVRKAKRVVFHPARTAVHAATPRSIRKVKRTAFNIAHPINTAENALLDSLTGRGSSRRRTGGTGASTYSSGYATATEERLAIGLSIQEVETANFSVHLAPVAPAAPPVAPPITEPDPAPERERIEQASGATDLATKLAQFGTPPAAPKPERVSVRAAARELYPVVTNGIPRWKLYERHRRREEARSCALEYEKLETAYRAATQTHEQQELDDEWARLERLRAAAKTETEAWIVAEKAHSEAARDRKQAELDAQWQRLLANDAEAVGAAIRDALDDAPVAVVGMVEGNPTALLAVVVPQRDQAVADREGGYTPTGRPTLLTRSKTRMNELYLAVIASRALFAANVALAAAPALEGVRCIALRADEFGAPEPIYAGTIQKSLLETAKRSAWNDDPDVLSQIPSMAFDVKMNQKGRAHELGALAPDADGSVKAVMDVYEAGHTSTPTSAITATQAQGVVSERIRKVGELHDQGTLSDAAFNDLLERALRSEADGVSDAEFDGLVDRSVRSEAL